MNLVVDEGKYKLMIEGSDIRIGEKIDDINSFIKKNKLKRPSEGYSGGLVSIPNKIFSVFNSKFGVMLFIHNNEIHSICLTLVENAPTAQDGIYDDDLCKLEVAKLIELITESLGRKFDYNRLVNGQGANRATWNTNWGRISVLYHIQTPSVGIYLSQKEKIAR